MSYCRFSSGDVYLYPSIYGGIECCGCSLAEKVNSIFTKGLPEDDPRIKFFGLEPDTPCEKCNGKGCDKCMMCGNLNFTSRNDAIKHLDKHVRAGHKVPQHAFDFLRKEIENFGDTEGLEIPDEPVSPLLDVTTGERIPLEELNNE